MMKQVWVIERFAPDDDHELTGFWVHSTHQGAVANAIKMAKEDADDMFKYDYRDNGTHIKPRVDVNGNQIASVDVDGSFHLLYTIKQLDVGA